MRMLRNRAKKLGRNLDAKDFGATARRLHAACVLIILFYFVHANAISVSNLHLYSLYGVEKKYLSK